MKYEQGVENENLHQFLGLLLVHLQLHVVVLEVGGPENSNVLPQVHQVWAILCHQVEVGVVEKRRSCTVSAGPHMMKLSKYASLQ